MPPFPSFPASAASALSLIAMLSGCGSALLQPSPRPDPAIPAPARFASAAQGTLPAAARPLADWWKSYRAPALNALVDRAMAGNLDIAVAVAQIKQAEAQAGITDAALLPSLSASASGERLRNASSTRNSQIGLGLSASYMLDFWGENRARSQAARADTLSARYNRDVVRISTQVSVATAYFEILSARRQRAILQENLANSKHILDLVQRQYAAGTVSELDVTQQQTLMAQIEASIPPVEETEGQTRAALAVLLGERLNDLGPLSGSLDTISVPQIAPGLPSQILLNRPDLRRAEADLAATGFDVDAARAALFPQISLTGTAGRQSAALGSLFSPGAWYYTLAAGLTAPLFDGFQLRNALASARAAQLASLETYRLAILSAFADVEKALIAVEQTGRQVTLQSKVVESSRRSYTIAEAQLAGGTASMISVLQAQQTLFSAEVTLASARLARLSATVSLYQALGAGWPDEDAAPPS